MHAGRRQFLRALAATSIALGTTGMSPASAETALVVFAAASLKNALDDIALAWATSTGRPLPRIAYSASGTMVRQIEAGAPADLFLSADRDWMDQAEERGLIRPGTRVDLVGNRLVLIAQKGALPPLAVSPGFDLAALLNGGRLAIGQVESVPAGRYGKAALQKLGAWEGVRQRLAESENVRAALLLVARGEAPLGLVFASDAVAEPRVAVVATIPAEAHPRIVYPAAIVAASRRAEADHFLAFLRSESALLVFLRHGFLRLETAPPPA